MRQSITFNTMKRVDWYQGESNRSASQTILSSDHAPNVNISMNTQLEEFEIAGRYNVFFPAKALVAFNGAVTVSAIEVADPVAVRYASRKRPQAILFNTEGLPASTFRTDD